MTKRVELPTDEEVEARIRLMTETTGYPPPAIAVARELQLSNATFWRYFPDIAQRLADARRDFRRNVGGAPVDEDSGLQDRTTSDAALTNSKTRAVRWEEDLQAAAAQIQRLTLENAALRSQLAEASSLLPLRPRDK